MQGLGIKCHKMSSGLQQSPGKPPRVYPEGMRLQVWKWDRRGINRKGKELYQCKNRYFMLLSGVFFSQKYVFTSYVSSHGPVFAHWYFQHQCATLGASGGLLSSLGCWHPQRAAAINTNQGHFADFLAPSRPAHPGDSHYH